MDKVFDHGRFWVALGAIVGGLGAVFGSGLPIIGGLFEFVRAHWNEFVIVAGGLYGAFHVRREVANKNNGAK